ncbi:hypothetical protein [Mycobacterium sp. 236(2023)]|uniref:hypothetical protein n=1 Tax=Mycobacterium sp. 236(2023) TaxID=3038163 RepID=UPI002414E146|nr:hypothetical protein [Mycobacterium sp. 236(2023)]MDG4665467.1 hypothetical protein [Mycobacterium sp. 236(2023)]
MASRRGRPAPQSIEQLTSLAVRIATGPVPGLRQAPDLEPWPDCAQRLADLPSTGDMRRVDDVAGAVSLCG